MSGFGGDLVRGGVQGAGGLLSSFGGGRRHRVFIDLQKHYKISSLQVEL